MRYKDFEPGGWWHHAVALTCGIMILLAWILSVLRIFEIWPLH